MASERDVAAVAEVLHEVFGDDGGAHASTQREACHYCLDYAAALLDSPAFRALIAEAEQRGREDNADHGQCYVFGSAALEGLLARERAAALREAADAMAPTHESAVPNLVAAAWLRDRAEAEEAGAS